MKELSELLVVEEFGNTFEVERVSYDTTVCRTAQGDYLRFSGEYID